MSIYYFDSSALVKYYLDEPGSTWVREIIDSHNERGQPLHSIYTTALTKVEVPSAIAIVRRVGRIREKLRAELFRAFMGQAMARFQFLAVNEHTLQVAAHLTQQHPLKAYDAIHLAVALNLQTDLDQDALSLTFVCGDARLLTSAAAVGLATDNPFLHTDLDVRP